MQKRLRLRLLFGHGVHMVLLQLRSLVCRKRFPLFGLYRVSGMMNITVCFNPASSDFASVLNCSKVSSLRFPLKRICFVPLWHLFSEFCKISVEDISSFLAKSGYNGMLVMYAGENVQNIVLWSLGLYCIHHKYF